jgi:hypothetical protein
MIDEPRRTLKIWQLSLFFSFPFLSFLSLSFLSFLFSFSLLLYFALYTTYDTTLYFTLHHQHHIFCAHVALEPPQEANTVGIR